MRIDLTKPFRDAKDRAANWTTDTVEEVCTAIALLFPGTESTYFDDYVCGGVSPRIEIPGQWTDTGSMAVDWVAIVWNQGPLVAVNPRYATEAIAENIKQLNVIVLEVNIMSGPYHMDSNLLDELFPDKLHDFEPDDIFLSDIFMYPL